MNGPGRIRLQIRNGAAVAAVDHVRVDAWDPGMLAEIEAAVSSFPAPRLATMV